MKFNPFILRQFNDFGCFFMALHKPCFRFNSSFYLIQSFEGTFSLSVHLKASQRLGLSIRILSTWR